MESALWHTWNLYVKQANKQAGRKITDYINWNVNTFHNNQWQWKKDDCFVSENSSSSLLPVTLVDRCCTTATICNGISWMHYQYLYLLFLLSYMTLACLIAFTISLHFCRHWACTVAQADWNCFSLGKALYEHNDKLLLLRMPKCYSALNRK